MAVNLPIAIKRVFLSFLQEWYATQDPKLIWNVDRRLTKIFIGDKFISSPEVVEKMPSIILSRGQLVWAQTSIDQMQTVDLPMSSAGMDPNKKRTDLVRASITFQCISQNGIEAETIANTLFLNLVGFKDQFRRNGIHQIMGISMGEETLLRSDVAPRLVAVPVNVVFTVQASIATTLDLFTIAVLMDTEFVPYAEGGPYGNVYHDWFSYEISGNQLQFSYPPFSGSTLATTFVGRYTLTPYSNVTPAGIVDGVNKVFTLPEAVYTEYAIFSGLVVDPITFRGI